MSLGLNELIHAPGPSEQTYQWGAQRGRSGCSQGWAGWGWGGVHHGSGSRYSGGSSRSSCWWSASYGPHSTSETPSQHTITSTATTGSSNRGTGECTHITAAAANSIVCVTACSGHQERHYLRLVILIKGQYSTVYPQYTLAPYIIELDLHVYITLMQVAPHFFHTYFKNFLALLHKRQFFMNLKSAPNGSSCSDPETIFLRNEHQLELMWVTDNITAAEQDELLELELGHPHC